MHRTARLLIGSVLIGFSGLIFAADRDYTTLTLPEALARVLSDNPELAHYPYDVRAAEARALQAGFRPNPRVSLEVENLAGSGELSGIDAMETTLALSQVIEMGGKRPLRQDVGQWRRQSIERDYELARLDVFSTAASRYLEVVQTQSLLAFAQQVVDFTTTAEAVAQKRFDAGSASRAELSRARTDLMQAKLAVSTLKVGLANAKRRLASLWGQAEADFSGVEAELFALAPVPDFSSIQLQLEQAPQLQRFMTLSRLRQAELDLAIARGRQDIEVGAGIRRFEETGDTGLVVQFSMPLGVFDRNQGDITAARQDLAKLDLEEKATRVKVFTELRNAFAQLEQARERVTVLREQILPEAQQALALVQDGYGDGRFSYLELVEARRQLLSFETEAVTAATDFHQTLITLETLTGQPLTGERESLYPPNAANPLRSELRLPMLGGAADHASFLQQDESE
ncbi:TolC family protein [Haliea sp. E1-2-M8]|uniref:TolC family protein n=1 Tax=Haliea sp. E1-2-M8 TaxID=3064706 RepID=UPI00271B9EA8|nr:TolC family protein [Haliea sp. E1-2-M8]MDO8863475.1 TolC family protein [Haliea sp. E1-2-M8]